MASFDRKSVSSFAQSALDLDSKFSELERLSGEFASVMIESDSGLDRARRLLAQFGECGQQVGDGVQVLARELEGTRARAEKAAQVVSNRVTSFQERQKETELMFSRLQALGGRVREVTERVALLKGPGGGELKVENIDLVGKHLPELTGELEILIGEAQKLKLDARSANMKNLETNVDSLGQTLKAACGRLSAFIKPVGDSPKVQDINLH